MKVAIIGQGPKGLFALCDLVRAWPADEPLEVHCYDPRTPGAGAGFALDQPPSMRINVRPEILHVPPMEPLDLWLRQRGIDPQGDVPRSMVGRYLLEARETITRSVPANVRIQNHSAVVRHLTRSSDGWLVGADVPMIVDEVLLTTGHAMDHDARLVHSWDPDQPTRLIPDPYPIQNVLDLEVVPPGCVLAVRGAGLTFLDIALGLSEARNPEDMPARILPIARSGQLPHAKPGPLHALLPDEQQLVDVMASTMPQDPDGVLDTIRQTAVELLVLAGHNPDQAAVDVASTLATGWEPDLQHPPRALLSLHRSIAIAEMAGRPGPAWMLARAWSALYPTVVHQLSFSQPEPDAWQRFLDASSTLGKFTFGPVLRQAMRMANLCEHGVVDLTWLEAEVTVSDRIHGLPEGEAQPDVIIDAVLSPPGVIHARTPLLDDLIQQGHARVFPGLRGIDITRESQCVGHDGTTTPGLSALGRSAEDVVVGNDTLGRTLHEQSTRWAARLAGSPRG